MLQKHHPNVGGKIWVWGHGGIWGNVPQGVFIFRSLNILFPLFSYQQFHKFNMEHVCMTQILKATLKIFGDVTLNAGVVW